MKQAKKLRAIMTAKGIIGLPLLIGFDINGPLASTQDVSMTPYKGASEVLRFLSLFPNVKICLATGWDYNTANLFASELIRLPDIDIVAEKGMMYSNNHKLYHLYPHSEVELEDFAEGVFDIAASKGLQIAIQPNISSGCQSIYFEGYRRAKLNAHPLLKGANIKPKVLEDILTRNMVEYSVQDNVVKIFATPIAIYNLLKRELPLFPFRVLDVNSRNRVLYIRIDPKEDQNFGWKQLEATAEDIAQRVNRSYDLNKDYSVDFSTNLAIQGGYTKDSALKVLGHKIFGDRHVIFIVGDKPSDRIQGEYTLFFPLHESEAMMFKSNLVMPVVDGREYALIIALYLSNGEKK